MLAYEWEIRVCEEHSQQTRPRSHLRLIEEHWELTTWFNRPPFWFE